MVGKHHLTITHPFSAMDVLTNIPSSIKITANNFYFNETHYKRKQSTGFVTGMKQHHWPNTA
jgi:hypothetical protein